MYPETQDGEGYGQLVQQQSKAHAESQEIVDIF